MTIPAQQDKTVTGGKGANLAEMASIGLPVPPGFTITTEECVRYLHDGADFSDELRAEVAEALTHIEASGRQELRRCGRSAARLGPLGRAGLDAGHDGHRAQPRPQRRDGAGPGQRSAATSASPGTAIAASSRCIPTSCSASITALFEEALEIAKEDNGYFNDTEMTAEDWQALVGEFKAIVERRAGQAVPAGRERAAVGRDRAPCSTAGIRDRAKVYRRLNDIPGDWGTAVNVQAMVFGNMGETSATGVAFTRDPATGEQAYYGEWLVNAQGEDVVAGIRTPQYLTKARARGGRGQAAQHGRGHARGLCRTGARVRPARKALQGHAGHRVHRAERGKLWMLQTRNGKRTAKAALKMAVDMVGRGPDRREDRDPAGRSDGARPAAAPDARPRCAARCAGNGPAGIARRGVRARSCSMPTPPNSGPNRGEKVILVRVETSPEDIHGMHAAQGILTARGGMTSHAAVVARGMGRPCVSGASARVDRPARRARCGSAAAS